MNEVKAHDDSFEAQASTNSLLFSGITVLYVASDTMNSMYAIQNNIAFS